MITLPNVDICTDADMIDVVAGALAPSTSDDVVYALTGSSIHIRALCELVAKLEERNSVLSARIGVAHQERDVLLAERRQLQDQLAVELGEQNRLRELHGALATENADLRQGMVDIVDAADDAARREEIRARLDGIELDVTDVVDVDGFDEPAPVRTRTLELAGAA